MANPKKSIDEILKPRNDGIEVTPDGIRAAAAKSKSYDNIRQSEALLTNELKGYLNNELNITSKESEKQSHETISDSDSSSSSDTSTSSNVATNVNDEKIAPAISAVIMDTSIITTKEKLEDDKADKGNTDKNKEVKKRKDDEGR